MRHLTVQQLSASLDGALVGVSLELVVRHLHSCRECRDRHARLAKQDDALRRLLAGEPGQAFVEDLAIRIEAIVDAEAHGRTPPPVRTTPAVEDAPGPEPYATSEPRAATPSPASDPFVVPEPQVAAPRAAVPEKPPVFTVAPKPAASPPPARVEPAAPPPLAIVPAAAVPRVEQPRPPMTLVPAAPTTPVQPPWPAPARPERILTVATPRTEIVLPPSAQAPPAAAVKTTPQPAPAPPAPPAAAVPEKTSSVAEPPPRVRVRRQPGDSHRARFALVSVAALAAVYIGLLVLPPVIRIPVPDLPVPRMPRFELVRPRPRATETHVTTATAPPSTLSSESLAPPTEKASPVPVTSRPVAEQPHALVQPAAARETSPPREPVVKQSPDVGALRPRAEQPRAEQAPAHTPATTRTADPEPAIRISVTPAPAKTPAPVRAPALAAAPAGDADDDWPLLCGEVLDEAGAPVAGARVLLADLDLTARTDKHGRFCIAAPAGDRTLSVQALGFGVHRQVVSLGTATLELRISLQSEH